MKTEVLSNLRNYEIAHFHIETLKIESAALKTNPLRDPHVRFNPILKPKSPGPWPVVVVLGGFRWRRCLGERSGETVVVYVCYACLILRGGGLCDG